jgi:hypothetical protein
MRGKVAQILANTSGENAESAKHQPPSAGECSRTERQSYFNHCFEV